MKLAIVTDAWRPQVNGVVAALTRTRECLEAFAPDAIHVIAVIFGGDSARLE